MAPPRGEGADKGRFGITASRRHAGAAPLRNRRVAMILLDESAYLRLVKRTSPLGRRSWRYAASWARWW